MYLTYPNLIHIHPFQRRKKRIENEAFDLKSHCIPLREMFWFENILYQVYMETVKRKRKIDTIG